MEFINENTYSKERSKISNLLNGPIHKFLGLTFTVILTVFLCDINIFLLLDKFPPENYSVFYYRVKTGKINLI
jgi:hypothetical protein